jgi:fucose permease
MFTDISVIPFFHVGLCSRGDLRLQWADSNAVGLFVRGDRRFEHGILGGLLLWAASGGLLGPQVRGLQSHLHHWSVYLRRGAMAFWPSAVLRSYPGFVVSNFIIPCGLSCLEVAANPFIALAGPGELSEASLNFAQRIQGVGGIIPPLIANSALLSDLDYQDLFRLQWCYLAVAFFVTLLALVFFYVPLSETSDQDLESMARQRLENAHLDPECKAFRVGARSLILWTGVFAMFVYLGAQQGFSNYWNFLVGDIKPGSSRQQTYLISRAVFTFGRFLGAGLAYMGVPPRTFLAV